MITDFGLARQETREGSHLSISDTGAVVGTPAYMAPEQVQGQPLTPAADLYALGIVIYEMVTGIRPFDGGSAITVAVKRLTEAPRPPRHYIPDLDPAWEEVILRCLNRDPAARCASAMEVVRALSGEVTLPAAGATSAADTASVLIPSRVGQRRARRLAPQLVAAGVGLAIAIAAYAVRRVRGPTAPPAPSAAQGAAAPVASVTPRRTLAVLGFKNVSGRADAAWLSTAISEMFDDGPGRWREPSRSVRARGGARQGGPGSGRRREPVEGTPGADPAQPRRGL